MTNGTVRLTKPPSLLTHSQQNPTTVRATDRESQPASQRTHSWNFTALRRYSLVPPIKRTIQSVDNNGIYPSTQQPTAFFLLALQYVHPVSHPNQRLLLCLSSIQSIQYCKKENQKQLHTHTLDGMQSNTLPLAQSVKSANDNRFSSGSHLTLSSLVLGMPAGPTELRATHPGRVRQAFNSNVSRRVGEREWGMMSNLHWRTEDVD